MKVIFAGDFCPQGRVAELIEKQDFHSVFSEVRPIINSSDYSVVNLECPVCEGNEIPIYKCGPNLQCKKSGVDALKWVGFDCVTLANNHFSDYGEEGVRLTLKKCKEQRVDVVGGGESLAEAEKVLYKDINGKTLAVINCCEHEFSIASESTSGCNPLNPIKQYYAIQEAKKIAQFVVVIVHGGHEHYQLPSIRMQEIYRFFVDSGADAVVNHHQHCYSGYEVYNNKPIFYGLGNFCFDYPVFSKNNPNWSYGYLLEINFSDQINYRIYPYKQSLETPSINMLPLNAFDKDLVRLNSIITNHKKLAEKQMEYYKSEEGKILSVFQPFRSKWLFAARRLRLFPTFMSGKWRVVLFNYISCESHREKVLYYLNSKK